MVPSNHYAEQNSAIGGKTAWNEIREYLLQAAERPYWTCPAQAQGRRRQRNNMIWGPWQGGLSLQHLCPLLVFIHVFIHTFYMLKYKEKWPVSVATPTYFPCWLCTSQALRKELCWTQMTSPLLQTQRIQSLCERASEISGAYWTEINFWISST